MSTRRGARLLMIEQGGRGGVADYTAELVEALAGEGWSVTLATAADHCYPDLPGVRVVGVFHYTRGERPLARALRERRMGKLVNGLRFLAALPRLSRLAARADIAHSQGWEAPQLGPPALAAMRLAGTPVVMTEHGMFSRGGSFRQLRERARRLTGRLAARTIVHTGVDLARARTTLGERAVVIPHGEYGGLARRGGAADRAAARAALGVAPDAHATLMYGQLRTDKGLDDLVAAVAQVPGTHLLVGGQDTGGLSAVREPLAALGERASVREGFLDMSETAELFAAADSVALPYREASQSGVLLLAYGFSRPVIVYPSGGMVEAVLDGETGWVCASAEVPALVRTLAEAVGLGLEECARRGRRGAEFSQERFAWPVIARSTGSLYDQVLSERLSRPRRLRRRRREAAR